MKHKFKEIATPMNVLQLWSSNAESQKIGTNSSEILLATVNDNDDDGGGDGDNYA